MERGGGGGVEEKNIEEHNIYLTIYKEGHILKQRERKRENEREKKNGYYERKRDRK